MRKNFGSQISALRNELHQTQVDESKLQRCKRQANIPWRDSYQCHMALVANKQSVADYIMLKVRHDHEKFGLRAVQCVLDEKCYGYFRYTAKDVTTWQAEQSMVFEFGRPVYKLPPSLMELVEDILSGSYGELTGYLKQTQPKGPTTDEGRKKIWIRKQQESIEHWFKDRRRHVFKDTCVSTSTVAMIHKLLYWQN